MASKKQKKRTKFLKTSSETPYEHLIFRYPTQDESDLSIDFQMSADRLASTYTGQPIDDKILVPFLSLYRQAFELLLKATLRRFIRLRLRYGGGDPMDLQAEISPERMKGHYGHNLHRLLDGIEQQYKSFELTEEFPRSVRQLVQEIHEADKSGTAFRYVGGLPPEQESADFPALVKRFAKEYDLLWAVLSQVEYQYEAMPDPEEYI